MEDKVKMRVRNLLGVCVLFVGCGTSPPPNNGPSYNNNANGPVDCSMPEEGCPCVTSGASIACGVVGSVSGTQMKCEEGLRTCLNGKWGKCDLLGKSYTKNVGPKILGLGNSTPCTGNPCNPYCNNYDDNAGGLDAGSNFTVNDGGLTLTGTGSCAGAPNVDDDGDGWTENDGDCNDCSPVVNPGAFDYPANGYDDDCSGGVDDAPISCDQGLLTTSNNPDDFVKAIDVCSTTTTNPPLSQRRWGAITGTAGLVRADAVQAPNPLQYGIMPFFGNSANNGAKKGQNLAVFSSGTARYTGQSGHVSPKGQCGSFYAGTTSGVPCGNAWNKQGCPSNTPGNDSSGMKFDVRVPTNAQCVSFRFHFFSSEYPEWVCTSYNDAFIAMLRSEKMVPGTGCCGSSPNVNCNISYGANFTPVSVNNNLFTVPGCTNCASPVLLGTGFDGSCRGWIRGGSTNWLYSFAPVKPGEIATFHTSVWDTGDMAWDSSVIVDDWTWYPGTCNIGTSPNPPTTVPVPITQNPYMPGTFSRDFQAVCPMGTSPVWRLYSWTSIEPSDSKLNFSVQTANNQSALNSAMSYPLTVSQGHTMAYNGQSDVKSVLPKPHLEWLRVNAQFEPSTNMMQVPTLFNWSQKYDCVPSE